MSIPLPCGHPRSSTIPFLFSPAPPSSFSVSPPHPWSPIPHLVASAFSGSAFVDTPFMVVHARWFWIRWLPIYFRMVAVSPGGFCWLGGSSDVFSHSRGCSVDFSKMILAVQARLGNLAQWRRRRLCGGTFSLITETAPAPQLSGKFSQLC